MRGEHPNCNYLAAELDGMWFCNKCGQVGRMTWPAPDPKKRRYPRWAECIAAWPECEEDAYHPNCCRFPKSCSCEMGDPRPWHIRERLLWPDPDARQRMWPWRQTFDGVTWPAADDSPEFLTSRRSWTRYVWRKVRKP